MKFENVVDYLFELGVSLGTKIIASAVILVLGLKLIKFLRKRIVTSSRFEKLDTGVRTFMSSFIGIALDVVLFITIAMILGIPTTSFITALASCGVAIGLALQGALSNLAGGIIILVFKPFKVGDYISAQGESGTVTKITVMYTSLTTFDNKSITIPNGTLTNAVVENYSTEDIRRVDIVFSASYSADVDKVKALLMDIMLSNDMILKSPEPFARLSKHGESSLEYTVRAWCRSEHYWDVYFDLLERVKKDFDENGISIPYPQIDVHINNTK